MINAKGPAHFLKEWKKLVGKIKIAQNLAEFDSIWMESTVLDWLDKDLVGF